MQWLCPLLFYVWWASLVLLLLPRVRRWLLPPQRRRAVPWGGFEVLAALLLVFFFWPLVVGLVVNGSGFYGLLYDPVPPEYLAAFTAAPQAGFPANLPLPGLFLCNEMSQSLPLRRLVWQAMFAFPFCFASVVLLLRFVSGARPYQLGLTTYRAGRNVLLAIPVWALLTPVAYLVLLGVQVLCLWVLEVPPDVHALARLAGQRLSPVEWGAIFLTAVVGAPLVEELVFRGVLQPFVMSRSWGSAAAVGIALVMAVLERVGKPGTLLQQQLPLLFVALMVPGYLALNWVSSLPVGRSIYATALLFAACHSSVWPSPVPLFLLGLGLGYLAYRTQSLVASVVVHALFNGVAFVVMLFLPAAAL